MWLTRQATLTPAALPPVSVLVSDFANPTQDVAFAGVLEQALSVGVEGASFVTAYPRRDALRLAAQLAPDKGIDEATAKLIALREGVGRVLAGSIEAKGRGYRLAVSLVDPNENKVLEAWSADAANKDAVLAAVGDLAVRVRQGLGDTAASGNARRNEESFTAASLDAARAYTEGQEHQWAGKYDEAYAAYQQAVVLDPDMGRAYAGLGAVANSLGRRDQAEEYYKQALARLSRMTDREKYRTRAGYYLLTRNPDKAREELQALLKQFPADSAGLSNLALAEFYRRDMAKAVELGLPGDRRSFRATCNARTTRRCLRCTPATSRPPKASARRARHQPGVSEGAPGDCARSARHRPAGRRRGDLRSSREVARGCGVDGRGRASRSRDVPRPVEGRRRRARGRVRRRRIVSCGAPDRRRLPRCACCRAAPATRATSPRGNRGNDDEGLQFLAVTWPSEAGQIPAGLAVALALVKKLDRESQSYSALLEGEAALARDDPRVAIERFTVAQAVGRLVARALWPRPRLPGRRRIRRGRLGVRPVPQAPRRGHRGAARRCAELPAVSAGALLQGARAGRTAESRRDRNLHAVPRHEAGR